MALRTRFCTARAVSRGSSTKRGSSPSARTSHWMPRPSSSSAKPPSTLSTSSSNDTSTRSRAWSALYSRLYDNNSSTSSSSSRTWPTSSSKRLRLAGGTSSNNSTRPKSSRVNGVRSSCDTALSSSRCWLTCRSRSLAMVSNTPASSPMLECGEMCVRSAMCPWPRRRAVSFRRSRSRQCGHTHSSRQPSMAAPIKTVTPQDNTLMSNGSGGECSSTSHCLSKGASTVS